MVEGSSGAHVAASGPSNRGARGRHIFRRIIALLQVGTTDIHHHRVLSGSDFIHPGAQHKISVRWQRMAGWIHGGWDLHNPGGHAFPSPRHKHMFRIGTKKSNQKPGDHPNFRKNALGVKRPFSELSESSRVFSEQLSEFKIPFSEYEIPFSEWHPTT